MPVRPIPAAPVTPLPSPHVCHEVDTQLRLARAQSAYLHRELAAAVKNAPMAPQDIAPDEALALEVQTLRERYAVLKLHYEDAQRQVAELKGTLAFYQHRWGGVSWSGAQTTLDPVSSLIDEILTSLLAVAHPDKWSQGQLATELAHELAVRLNALRAHVTP